MTKSAFIIGAKRTPVAPRGGALAQFSAFELGQYTINALLSELQLDEGRVGCTIFGNALYGGGNPARLSALAAGIPESTPAFTIDTQCCSGMDALHLASSLICSGAHDLILAGGTESFSTAPRRFKRVRGDKPDIEYSRPPFSPWADRDPDMLVAAAALAAELKISRPEQEAFARKSHAKAQAAAGKLATECHSLSGLHSDSFTRDLSERMQQKLPLLTGEENFGITASTTAVEADGCAVCAIVSEDFLSDHPEFQSRAVQILGGKSIGSDPAMPALAPVAAVKSTLDELSLNIVQFGVFEVMEAFACQAIACMKLSNIDPAKTNLGGGALARGHPIGASGAINAIRLYNEMVANKGLKLGLATIAGAGGLASTLVLRQ